MADEGNGWIWKAVASGGLRAWAYHITIVYLIPLGAPLVAAGLGYAQGYPWMYIFVASLVAFAAIATALLRFDEWRFRNAVKDKLVFTNVRIARNIHGPGWALGVGVQNSAQFPIDWKMEEVRTQIAATVPTGAASTFFKIEIPPNGQGWWDDRVINFTVPSPGTVEGFIEYRYRYGRNGSLLRHKGFGKKQVTIAFDGSGNFIHAAVNDAT